MIIEGIKIYNISDNALNYFRNNAKYGKSAPKEVLQRKLSALIHNNFYEEKSDGTTKYHFNGFRMFVNDETDTIFHIYWSNDKHYASLNRNVKHREKQLRDTFKMLGLNSSGNNWSKS